VEGNSTKMDMTNIMSAITERHPTLREDLEDLSDILTTF
jgi:hypothetical protein